MKAPRRLLESDPKTHEAIRGLLRAAERSRPMSGADRAKAAANIAHLAARPATAAAGAAWAKIIATIMAVGLSGALVVGVAQRDRHVSPSRLVAARPAPSTPSTLPTPQPAAGPVMASPHSTTDPAVPADRPVAASARIAAPTQPRAISVVTPRAFAAPRAIELAHASNGSVPVLHASETAESPPATGLGSGSSVPGESAVDPLEAETAALALVLGELDGDPSAALAALGQFDRRFPHPQMEAERAFIEVDALSRAGRAAEARARAEALVARFPRSPYVRRVSHLLASPSP